jgi:hypothetical protein
VAVVASAQQSINLSSLLASPSPQSASAPTTTDNNMIKFDLKIVNVDSTSARFEITDDNRTTINYAVSYVLTSSTMTTNPSNGEDYLSDTIKITKDFQLQTNSLNLLNKQEELLGDADARTALTPNLDENTDAKDNDDDSGEKYNEDDKEAIKNRNYEDVHRFLVEDLEPNRYYEINFTIRAKLAHLSSSLLLLSTTRLNNSQRSKELVYKRVETTRQLQFKFKTTFDLERAAVLACNNSKYDEAGSCYAPNSDCLKCKPTCYQVRESRNQQQQTAVDKVLCEACPCDTSRSTGECSATDPSTDTSASRPENRFLQAQVIKCTQCIRPYMGSLCNECENDGVDYYKNEFGQCVECNCNGNSAYENLDSVARSGYKRRKCQAITGKTDFLFEFPGF